VRPRLATHEDFPPLLALNAEQVRFLSPLDEARLAHLHAESAWHQVIEDDTGVCAFLLAFAPGAHYDSPNYRWFEARGGRFLYIDRIVVAASAQGKGCGRQLYAALFDYAREAGSPDGERQAGVDAVRRARRRRALSRPKRGPRSPARRLNVRPCAPCSASAGCDTPPRSRACLSKSSPMTIWSTPRCSATTAKPCAAG
jgi:predicted GNAT superfamily acetyltransferase